MNNNDKHWSDHSEVDNFNKESSKTEAVEEKNYTREEMYTKVNNYSRTAPNDKDLSFMNKSLNKYEEKFNNKDANTLTRKTLFNKAKEAGLHANVTHDDIDRERTLSDQQDRNDTVRATRQYYHQNYSLKKSFTIEAAKKPKDIDKDIS